MGGIFRYLLLCGWRRKVEIWFGGGRKRNRVNKDKRKGVPRGGFEVPRVEVQVHGTLTLNVGGHKGCPTRLGAGIEGERREEKPINKQGKKAQYWTKVNPTDFM